MKIFIRRKNAYRAVLYNGHNTMLYSQNVPLSKRPIVETSQSHNVPSQNVPPWSKRPESNRPHIKITPCPY